MVSAMVGGMIDGCDREWDGWWVGWMVSAMMSGMVGGCDGEWDGWWMRYCQTQLVKHCPWQARASSHTHLMKSL